jgi:hypothetical protein
VAAQAEGCEPFPELDDLGSTVRKIWLCRIRSIAGCLVPGELIAAHKSARPVFSGCDIFAADTMIELDLRRSFSSIGFHAHVCTT